MWRIRKNRRKALLEVASRGLLRAVATIALVAAMIAILLYVTSSRPHRDLSNRTFGLETGMVGVVLAASDQAAKVDWRTLRGLNYRTGEQTPALKSVNGKTARVPGFMVPLEDDNDQVSEFLLVPYVGACVHTPPPPPNQIVHVKMDGGRKTKVSFWEPVWVQGRLDISTVKSPHGDVSFKMSATLIEPYKE